MEWYKESVFYHIYPLGLLGAPLTNTYDAPVHRLHELDKWISHIKELNCNAIYIGPLFESVGHGYETTDYKKLDSRLGDNEDLKKFVKNCHKAGIRVIFDGVFNHTGRDFFAFKDIQEHRENSKYRDWYCNVNFWGNNEYNDGFSYDNWGGYNLLVKLNHRNPEVRQYICGVVRFWVQEFDLDGIRLDAADVLDFDFMKELRYVTDGIKSDFWLMGEVIHGEYSRWANGNTLHSVTNYVLHKALYSGHNDKNYFEIAHTIKRLEDMFGGNHQISLYNFTDNHDVERIISKLNNKNNYYPVHILTYTLPGVPSVYYGSEFGLEGKKERGSDASLRPRLVYDDYADAINNNQYTKFISFLGNVRLKIKTLSEGDYKELKLTNKQYVFSRNTNMYSCIVAVNNDGEAASIDVSGCRDGIYHGLISGRDVEITNGYININIPGNYGEIYVSQQELSKSGYVFEPIELQEMQSRLESKDSTQERKVAQRFCEESKITCNIHIDSCDGTGCDMTMDNNGQEPGGESSTDEAINDKIGDSKSVGSFNSGEDADNLKSEEATKNDNSENMVKINAVKKYGLDNKYSGIYPDEISRRNDYDNMTIEELQIGILEKMSKNGPVNGQMIGTVMENHYPDSLRNWIKSFR